jgi:hypothetical protein
MIVLLAGLGLSQRTALATVPEHQRAHASAAGSERPDGQPTVRLTPLLADWLDIILNPIVSFVNTRQRMIQVGALIMLLALTIIWWRK